MLSLLIWTIGFAILGLGFSNRHRFLGKTLNEEPDEQLTVIMDKNPSFRDMIRKFEKRRVLLKWVSDILNVAIFAFVGYLSFLFFSSDSGKYSYKVYLFILLTLPLLLLIKRPFFNLKRFTRQYKNQVLSLLIKAVNPALGYKSDGVLPLEIIKDSEIFNLQHFANELNKNYQGEDLIYGEVNGVGLAFSDVEAFSGIGKEVKLVFTGTFLSADFPFDFKGKTFVVPDLSASGFKEDLLSKSVTNKKTFKTEGDRVDLVDPTFEKIYDVFSTNEEEARYIMSPQLRKSLLKLDGEANDKVVVALSFIGNQVFIGMLFNYLKFEPSLNIPLDRMNILTYAYNQLNLVLEVVAEIQAFHKNKKASVGV
ncbi:DUF3137 domain-containing protein [Cytophagales bacterium LB-30]|uniref:DUF3137 domain-containing protein n=1 Tax=Shiella aurantiaca TaxID=3058365 RepID=A0ABT8F261_9BACT|nr:DUF3137 domain-containing protein [Shiella aurantiaca]MDN4164336.1 DUF3137 domain-containing protein [Shiella aurantiaca]